MRKQFDEKLANHMNQLKEMSVVVNEQLATAMEALKTIDLKLAQKVIDADEKTNQFTVDIERESYLIIATEQPVATDLRLIFAVLLASVDLERIGDHACSIAEQVIEHQEKATVESLEKIVSEMAVTGQQMLIDVIEAFDKGDVDSAMEIADRDDKIDDGLQQVLKESKDLLKAHQEQPITSISYIRIANNLERIGDYITNICERVIYLETHRIIELG